MVQRPFFGRLLVWAQHLQNKIPPFTLMFGPIWKRKDSVPKLNSAADQFLRKPKSLYLGLKDNQFALNFWLTKIVQIFFPFLLHSPFPPETKYFPFFFIQLLSSSNIFHLFFSKILPPFLLLFFFAPMFSFAKHSYSFESENSMARVCVASKKFLKQKKGGGGGA